MRVDDAAVKCSPGSFARVLFFGRISIAYDVSHRLIACAFAGDIRQHGPNEPESREFQFNIAVQQCAKDSQQRR